MKVPLVNCYLAAKLAREFEIEITSNLVLPHDLFELNFMILS
jgi:hypothetical protein